MKYIFTITALTALVACGSDQTERRNIDLARSVIDSAVQTLKPGDVERPQLALSPADIAALDYDLMLLRVDLNGAVATLTVEGGANGVKEWMSPDQRTIATRNGQVITTRGFGPDIYAARFTDTLRALTPENTGEQTHRTYKYLDSEDAEFDMTFICGLQNIGPEQITIIGTPHNTVRFNETCVNSDHEFTNLYWIDVDDGFIWQSRQWISPLAESISIQILSRDIQSYATEVSQ